MRIWKNGNQIDADGGGGNFTKFKIHYVNMPNGVKLESDRFPGRYVAVKVDKSVRVGSGGKHCLMYFCHAGGGMQQQQQPRVVVVQQQQPRVVIQQQPMQPQVIIQQQQQPIIQQQPVYRQPQPVIQVQQQQQPQVTVIKTNVNANQGMVSGQQGYNAPYGFKMDKEVIVRGPYMKSLRVGPRQHV
jgi:hypothetical protein